MDPKDIISQAIELKRGCLSCKNCSLCQNIIDGIDPHVYAYGNLASPIVFCSEAPGQQETIQKIPLIGQAGQVYEKYILKPLGFDRKDVWTTNICCCRPPNNRKPTIEERDACSSHLQAQLKLIKPKLLVALGSTPMAAMLGIENGITKLAGQKYHSQKYDIDVFVMFHTSYILRTGQYEILGKHVDILKSLINQIISNE